MVRSKSATRCPHWNSNLHLKWKALTKARKRARASGLRVDEEELQRARKSFQKENRRWRRQFASRTENLLTQGPNGNIVEAINKDRKGREESKRAKITNGEPLNPAYFTEFMASKHDHNQEVI